MGDYSMILAAKSFAAYLEMKNIKSFTMEELNDAHKSVIFRTSVMLRGISVPLGVIVDDSIYTMVRANISTQAITDENAFAVSALMTRLNYQSKLFKYYLAPDTSIIMDACIPQAKAKFNPELVLQIVDVAARELNKNYGEFVKCIWHD